MSVLADLLQRHPWPRELADARRLEWAWTIDVPATSDQLWPLLADLSRLNRALRLPPMTFVERDGVREGSARYTGVFHRWIELPWNWVAGRWFELTRTYQRGSMRALRGIYELEPHAAGTRVSIYYGVVPRSRVFDLGLKWSFGAMRRAYERLLPRAAAELASSPTPPCLAPPPPTLTDEGRARIAQLRNGLTVDDVSPSVIERLIDWVATAPDTELERIRVRERARAWSVDEDELLRLCLHATRAGLLELSWDVICPHCRGVRESTGALSGLPTGGECEPCGIRFGTDQADAVEVTFHVHPSIRSIAAGVYCSAEPAHKPHIHIQRMVAAGESVDVAVPSKPGTYRMRVKGEMRGAWLEVAESAERQLVWTAGAELVDSSVAPNGVLRLVNPAAAPVTFVVETAAWLELALRPGKLLSFQTFRDLFSKDYLATGVQLAVGEQTILFTDLVGSTAMYEERGDPAAFVAVKQHFDRVFAIIGENRGAVVKTIGDAVMGAFNDPVDAVKAARAIHAAFPPSDNGLRLRISINTGPCIAVRFNASVDYFGHAVNVAAKLQALAEGWQIAISERTADDPRVAAWLAEQSTDLERVELELKGLGPQRARRWTVTD